MNLNPRTVRFQLARRMGYYAGLNRIGNVMPIQMEDVTHDNPAGSVESLEFYMDSAGKIREITTNDLVVLRGTRYVFGADPNCKQMCTDASVLAPILVCDWPTAAAACANLGLSVDEDSLRQSKVMLVPRGHQFKPGDYAGLESAVVLDSGRLS